MRINWNFLKTFEFLAWAASNAGFLLARLGNTVQPRDQWLFLAVSSGAYALARGFAKYNKDTRHFWETSEFYVVLVGGFSAAWAGFQTHVSATTFTEVSGFLALAGMIANGLRTPPSTAVKPEVQAAPTTVTLVGVSPDVVVHTTTS